MRYYSTHRQSPTATLAETVLQGVAPDGGLYMPERLPLLPRALFNNMGGMTLREVSYVVANTFFSGDIAPGVLKEIVDSAMSFDIPLVATEHPGIWTLQMFHGPGGTSKDVGVRFMAHLAAHFRSSLPQDGLSVLAATDGDIGDALAASFHDLDNVTVYLLYPRGCAPRRNHPLLTDPHGKVVAIVVDGTLDQCQDMIRMAFADGEVASRHRLTTVNSVNIARIVAQIFPFFHAYAQLAAKRQAGDSRLPEPVVSIPCGNLGNLVAGVMARRMGLPVKRFIAVDCASSPSVPANRERLLDLYGMPLDTPVDRAREAKASEIMFMLSEAPVPGAEYPALKALRENLRPGETGICLEATMGSRACNVLDSPWTSRHPERQSRLAHIPATYPALRRILLHGR